MNKLVELTDEERNLLISAISRWRCWIETGTVTLLAEDLDKLHEDAICSMKIRRNKLSDEQKNFIALLLRVQSKLICPALD